MRELQLLHTVSSAENTAETRVMVQRYVLVLDLIDDDKLIAEYEAHHQSVWPEVEQQILATGILSCQIYRVMNRLCMILDTEEGFSFERKAAMDAGHHYTQSWEELMWQYQKALPCAAPGQKWVMMEKIYELPREKQ